MLTIKSPIQIRCKSPMETVHSDFSEKIIGNYSVMNSRLRKEELLYITTQAPEVYFAEGNSISVLNDINLSSNQEIKLDMINNLINRILVSGTDNFTYQDSVYISNVLRKLGITDVNNFMKNVHKLQEEKRENNKLINVYEEQKNLLTSVFAQINNDKTSHEVNNETNKEYHNRYYIHEEIYNRLDTANVYNEVKQFCQGLETDAKRIYDSEITIAEQVLTAQNFQLHNLKKEIFNSTETINYFHANTYELADNEELPASTQQEKITSAILLNLVDEMYSLRINNIEKNNHNWYILASTLFQTADNTWKRYENYHSENKQVSSDMYSTMVQLVENKKQENNIINNIIREMKTINEVDELVENQITNSVIQKISSPDNITYNTQKNKFENRNGDISIHQSEYIRYEDINRGNDNYYDETVNINYLEEFRERSDENESDEQVSEITRHRLEEINRRNIENYKRIQEIEKSRPHITNVEINKEKAKADTLRALNSPQEVIMEYLQSQTNNSFEEINKVLDSEVFNLFSDETKAIFNQYIQQKNGQIPGINNINTNVINDYSNEQYFNTDVNMEHMTIIGDEQTTADDVINEIHNSKTDKYETINQNMYSKNSQFQMFDNSSTNINNDYNSSMYQNTDVYMEHKKDTDDNNDSVEGKPSYTEQQIHNELNVRNTNTREDNTIIDKKIIDQFFEQGHPKVGSQTTIIEGDTRIRNDINNIMYRDNPVIMEHMDMVEPESVEGSLNETHIKSSVKYEINEVIQKNIQQLRNYSENNLYNNFIMGTTGKGIEKPLDLINAETSEIQNDSPELQHFIMETHNKEIYVQGKTNERTVTMSKVGLVHKVEEQIITEDLINTIRSKTIDNHKEETIEHNTSNIVKNEKHVHEVVNSVHLDKRNNIEEIVQQNVQKQINHISDQVYGKIEKKLQTERKRRGY